MAISIHYYTIIIPIKNIEKCKKIGGFKGVLEKQKRFVGGKVIYDDYLYKDSCMGPGDAQKIIDFWEEQGLVSRTERDGQRYWHDLCVIDELEGMHLPCEWLECDKDENGRYSVWLKGKPKGKIISRLNFSNHYSNFFSNLIRRIKWV